jgi:hypothetical protein
MTERMLVSVKRGGREELFEDKSLKLQISGWTYCFHHLSYCQKYLLVEQF